jgi:hypothetical protein
METTQTRFRIIKEPVRISEHGIIRYVYVDYGTGILFPDTPQLIYFFTLN